MKTWTTVNHPNIALFLGISFDFDIPDVPCLVTPYYSHGDIISYTRENPDANKLRLIAQVADALSHLHNHSIIHGEIHGGNILVNDNLEVCLTDFGISRDLQRASSFPELKLPPSFEGISTPLTIEAWRWKSPELMTTRLDENGLPVSQVTTGIDVWAFAMTVVEILTGRIPFSDIRNDAKVVLAVMEGHHPERSHCPQINDKIWETLESCWDLSTMKRPSMAMLSQFFALQSTS
jgi:serine/threonine protein kinase